MTPKQPTPREQIVVLGGGFAGVRFIQRLAEQKPVAEITLVSQEAYQTYTPSLYEVASGRHPRLVCFAIEDCLTGLGVTFRQATVTGIDVRRQLLRLDDKEELAYDQLVLALGMVTNDYGIPGVKEFAFPLKTAQDAWLLRQHIEAEYRDAQDDQAALAKRKLRFLIAGGGPTGVELAGGLAEFRARLSRRFGVPPHLTTLEICEAGPEILGGKDTRVIQAVRRRLRSLGVKIKTNSPVKANEVRAVVIGNERESTETLIWTAGLKVPKLIASLNSVQKLRDGRIAVDGYLRAVGRENIWVIGDIAGSPDSGTAQIALHQADSVADNLNRFLNKERLIDYELATPILVIPIGARFAIVRLGRWVITGWPGMLLRSAADLRYLLNLLPFREAIATWLVRNRPCPDCRMQLRQLLSSQPSVFGRQI
jgi:NADH dehydrogenase